MHTHTKAHTVIYILTGREKKKRQRGAIYIVHGVVEKNLYRDSRFDSEGGGDVAGKSLRLTLQTEVNREIKKESGKRERVRITIRSRCQL